MIEYTVYAKDRTVLQSGTAQSKTHVRQVFPNHHIEFGVQVPITTPPRADNYALRRRRSYPTIGDQLDALWKGGEEAAKMAQRIAEVKAAHPKEDD